MPVAKNTRSVTLIMAGEPVYVVPSMSIPQIAHLLDENEIFGAPVATSQGRVVEVESGSGLIHRCWEGTRERSSSNLFEVISDLGANTKT